MFFFFVAARTKIELSCAVLSCGSGLEKIKMRVRAGVVILGKTKKHIDDLRKF